MNTPAPLQPQDLYLPCPPEDLPFETTDELPDLDKVLGQPRALQALELGSEVQGPGFNIFVAGLPDSGRTTLTREYLERKAAAESVPDDWCYVFNFKDPHRPRAINLPAGQAVRLRDEMQQLVQRCQDEIRRVFASEEYNQERNRLGQSMQSAQEQEFQKLVAEAQSVGFTIARTPTGISLIPLQQNGQPLPPEAYEKLPAEQKERLRQTESQLQLKTQATLRRIKEIGEAAFRQLQELDAQTARFALQHIFEALSERYQEYPKVQAHLQAVQEDMVQNVDILRGESESPMPLQQWLSRYAVNVLVDNSHLQGAPVVMESHPTYQNLVGRIEHRLVMGVTQTHFTMIRPGALHRANGGYLLLPARDILVNPYAWQGLERALRDGEIRILELGSQMGMLTTVSLEPEPIPLRVKVVLFGTSQLHEMLRELDVDFGKLFKVRAQFASTMERTPENIADYSLFIKSVVLEHNLPPFDRTAVARIIEHSARMAGDQHKLTTRFGQISNLVREAAYWAGKAGHAPVTAADVERAIEAREYRDNLPQELTLEQFSHDTLLIQVSGRAIGQVNALSVLQFGDYAFGRPSRVTAAVHPGNAGIVDIERQANLGGPIHTKGVLIISGLLGERYGQNKPLNLSAHLTFEQSYSGVEGDSASTAELCALLSALARIPLRQDRAITGSINQRGEVQAIGGVNEKIEGFFAVCQAKGLTGEQGVIIPAANIRHLMLKREVVDAVAAGQFHIWPVRTLDEALALLCDCEVGERDEDGHYPEGSFNAAVDERLEEFRQILKGTPQKEDAEEGHDDEQP